MEYAIDACFDSYYQGSYCFVNMEGTTYEFQAMEPNARQKYDLTEGSYLGRMFTVVYRNENTDWKGKDEDGENEEHEEEDQYPNYVIIDLELIG